MRLVLVLPTLLLCSCAHTNLNRLVVKCPNGSEVEIVKPKSSNAQLSKDAIELQRQVECARIKRK